MIFPQKRQRETSVQSTGRITSSKFLLRKKETERKFKNRKQKPKLSKKEIIRIYSKRNIIEMKSNIVKSKTSFLKVGPPHKCRHLLKVIRGL